MSPISIIISRKQNEYYIVNKVDYEYELAKVLLKNIFLDSYRILILPPYFRRLGNNILSEVIADFIQVLYLALREFKPLFPVDEFIYKADDYY